MQGNYTQAETLYERAQAIREKVLGPQHPDMADLLNNRAILLNLQVGTGREHDLNIQDRAGIQMTRSSGPERWA